MMKPLRILVSAAGAPGCSTLIRMLKTVKERKNDIVAVDMDGEAIGRFLADSFYQVPPADHDEYLEAMLDVVRREEIDVFYVVSSAEILKIAENRGSFEDLGCRVTASRPEAIRKAANKYVLYKTLSQNTDVPVPEFYNPGTLDEFVECAHKLGYPENRVCFKPHDSKGSRGFRILDAHISRRDLLLNYKPESTFMSLEEFTEIFSEGEFPELMIMEHVEGTHYDAMCLADDGVPLLTTIKTREASRWGIIVKGELVDKPALQAICDTIVREIGLSYNFGLQFIEDKIIEINPRPSTFIYQDDLIEPYIAIKLALGEIGHEEVKSFQKKIHIGRRMVRYMDQVFWNQD
ncbi:MAG: ATP-grasp domain-containing protein [Syntrophaceae bacterium]|nr:ATP-grasp domain-containing protein [Syntrophaceae bacterium]